jgi:hypothetical protein
MTAERLPILFSAERELPDRTQEIDVDDIVDRFDRLLSAASDLALALRSVPRAA